MTQSRTTKRTTKKITYLTLFPELIKNYLSDALLKKAEEKKIIEFEIIALRNFSKNKYKSIDDKVFGGGDGMVFTADVLAEALADTLASTQSPSEAKPFVIYMSPQGIKLDQEVAKKLSTHQHLVIVSGRYGGVDERFIKACVDLEVSIGDYVVSGGELPSLVLTEAIGRCLPGFLGDEKSLVEDSHYDGLLEAPQFTKPQKINLNDHELAVPEVLLSGDHKRIAMWKHYVAILVTLKKRPDLVCKKYASNFKNEFKNLKTFYNQDLEDKDKELLNLSSLDLDKLYSDFLKGDEHE